MRTVFLAWQDPQERGWFPIGRLDFDGSSYTFRYIEGARKAERECAFEPLPSFPKLAQIYQSQDLFPLFANRLPPESRSDYGQYLEWLNVAENPAEPIALLARNGGRKVTDSFEVYPAPERQQDGSYRIHFFVHGLRHLPKENVRRIDTLRQNENLLIMHDLQNPHDPSALMLRTNDKTDGDRYFVGYLPRYIVEDVHTILKECKNTPEVHVERINLAPAPLQLRLLCNLTACWPDEFRPFASKLYQPISSQHSTPA